MTASYAGAASLAKLAVKGRRPAVGFAVASAGEIQFFKPVLERFLEVHPEALVVLVHHEDSLREVEAELAPYAERLIHTRRAALHGPWLRRLDLYVTTEQFSPSPPGVYTIALFHGQPSKGVTFRLPERPSFPRRDALACNDAFFLYGPLHRQALEEHLAIRGEGLPPHLDLFDIGYSKSDALLQGRYDRAAYLTGLGLDPSRRTVLYAPAFNEGASLREQGVEILEALCAIPGINVLAKLAIDCLRPTTDLEATGGVDWFAVIGRLEASHPNFRLVRDVAVDPSLAAADLLVTCISSVSFEFLALRKPVIYVDTPRYFSEYLPAVFPELDTSGWKDRTAVNAGREFGPLVANAKELKTAVKQVLAHPDRYPARVDELPARLLFNPGRAAEAAVAQMDRLIAAQARSRRRGHDVQAYLDFMTDRVPVREKAAAVARGVRSLPRRAVARALRSRGYELARIGAAYIDPETTVPAARDAGMSVCDYRESLEDNPRKRGRRDRIIRALKETGALDGASTVVEIGPGTGMYLEKVIDAAHPQTYEVYETHRGWADFLRAEYGGRNGCRLVLHAADGRSLAATRDRSCDLVHAHGVFVYLPLLQVFGYLKECVRVCAPGGHIAFDCFTDRAFAKVQTAEDWLRSGIHFPVVIPKALLDGFADEHGLVEAAAFQEVYGAGAVDYVVWRKAA